MSLIEKKLVITMVGLPANGKSTTAQKIRETLADEGISARIFNNGEVRRRLFAGEDTSRPGFYDPGNRPASELREKIARISAEEALDFLAGRGEVAILDATNLSRTRRQIIEEYFAGMPLLFIECLNDDPELLAASIARKAKLPEFAHLSFEAAVTAFTERLGYYRQIADPLDSEDNYIALDTLRATIVRERLTRDLPHYPIIRDLLASDWVKNLYVARHGESWDNLDGLIGGDSELTPKGMAQAGALAAHFKDIPLNYIFTSTLARSRQTAAAVSKDHPEAKVIALSEFNEIWAGICEGLSFAAVRQTMPEVYAARMADKYGYVYPQGEGYATMAPRVARGIKKCLYLSGNAERILVVGHQAVNRMILSSFLFRRLEDVPHVFIPQNRYFHIQSTPRKRLVELTRY